MDLLDVGRIVAGLALLVLGGELLVRGASALARRVGISSLVVGLTVVSAEDQQRQSRDDPDDVQEIHGQECTCPGRRRPAGRDAPP